MTATLRIVRLKVTLDDVKPTVMRRIEVPLDIRLDQLHVVMQVAIGWENYHLWEFRTRKQGWGIPDPTWDLGPEDAKKATLATLVEGDGAKSFQYLYDFGDSWEHTVKVERICEAEADATYPRLIEAAGRCPPEDIGGPWAYADFLDALGDPEHELYEELSEWREAGFDPKLVDIALIERELLKLAKKRAPAAKAKRQGKKAA